jgi:hypothetical protein
MKCLGSSLFLKNRFGAGYKLTMVKSDKKKNNKIGSYLEDKFPKCVEKMSEVASEITYQISSEVSHQFKAFFAEFDKTMTDYGIQSYGISITTLEEVFLKINQEFNIKITSGQMEENVDDDRGIEPNLG